MRWCSNNYGCVITQTGREIKRHLDQISGVAPANTERNVSAEVDTDTASNEDWCTTVHANLRKDSPDMNRSLSPQLKGGDDSVVDNTFDSSDSSETELNKTIIEIPIAPSTPRPTRNCARKANESIKMQYKNKLA